MGLLKVDENLTMWFAIPGLDGLDFECKYLTPATLKRLRDKATKKVPSRQNRSVMEDETDSELYSKFIVREMVKNWRGFTVDNVKKVFPITEDAAKEIEKLGELPFSQEDLEALSEYTYARDLLDPVTTVCCEMSEWRRAEQAKKKLA